MTLLRFKFRWMYWLGKLLKLLVRKKKFCEHLAIAISKEVVRKHKIDLRKFKHYIESREIEERWKF